MHRFFRTLEKNQRHTITGCNTNQFAGCTTLAELRCRSHNLIELLHHFALLVYKQSGVTHYVNKQHVSNFQMWIGSDFCNHVLWHSLEIEIVMTSNG